MKEKGFTLIELLGAVIILGILLSIAVPSITKYLNKGKVEYYHSLESEMKTTGLDYLETYRTLLPRRIGNVTVIDLEELVVNKYIDEVKDEAGNLCSGKVTVKKVKTGKYEYYSCLDCGSSYKTEGNSCEYSEEDNTYVDQEDYDVRIEKDSYSICQGDSFTLPYAKAYYKFEELVNDKVEGRPNKIDTNKLGKTEVKYSYHGASKKITVEVKDCTLPTKPEVVLKKDNANGESYISSNWYKGDIYQKFKSTDYVSEGISGSGIKTYLISKNGIGFEKVENGNYILDTENGEHIRWIKSVDKSGNESGVTKYTFKIDKEDPTCKIEVISGTEGLNNWYTSDVTIDWKSKEDKVSGIKTYNIDSSQITSDIKDKKVTGTVEDEAGNKGYCYETVSVDKTNPTVSYNVAGGIYRTNKTLTITASDKYYSYMNIQVNKNNSVSNQDNNITSKTKSYTLTDGNWTVYTKVYDESGRKQSQEPENESGWYYQSYLIDTQAPTCSLKVTSGTSGNNGWYISNVTVGFDNDNTSGTGSNIVQSSISQTSITSEGTTVVTGTVTDQAGNIGQCSKEIKIEKSVTTPTITYNGGSNSCSWKNNYNLTLFSSSKSGISTYEIDWNNDGVVDTTTGSNFIPWNGYSSCTTKFRALSNAGNRSNWTSTQHIHMDTERPTHTNWWWGTVTKDNAPLYIQATDNVGISRVQCPTSTQTGSYNNWHWFNAVWDSSQNAYRCDITPATFAHYNQVYQTHLYIYDHAGNGGYYTQTSVTIPATCSYNIGQTWEFNYTGGVQDFTVPCSGTYKLEVYGAQGGNQTLSGGKGGYVRGNISLNKLDMLYIGIGGAGSKTTGTGAYDNWTSNIANGGFNGGADGVANGHKDGVSYAWHTHYRASGGGATHMALNIEKATLADYSDSTEALLVVAGGGGAAIENHEPQESGKSDNSYDFAGGAGGVEHNENTPFGANTSSRGDYPWSGGAGGGYKSGHNGDAYPPYRGSSGGTNYIKSNLTETESVSGTREGNGYAKITLVSID